MSERAAPKPLGLGSVVLFGVAYMAPMIALGTFGVLREKSGDAVPSSYLLALVAMLFTARSYGRMAREFPVAGSAYTYTRRSFDGRIGFLVGWAVLLDYCFLPMVAWLIGASYLHAQFPQVPVWAWILAFIALTTTVNVLGLRMASVVSLLLLTVQLLIVVFFAVECIRFASGHAGVAFGSPFGNANTTVGGVAAGAAVATYSFLGFDAISTLTEETRNPKHTIPKAILLALGIAGVVFLLTSYSTQLAAFFTPETDPDSAALEIARTAGGALLSAIFLAGLVVTQIAAGIAIQASSSRLLFAMGRDGVLPKRVFGYLHPRFRTPVANIVIIGFIGLIGISLDVSSSTAFVNFGAFVAYAFVNLSVLATAIRRRAVTGTANILRNVVPPVVGTLVCGWLLTSLDVHALTIGPIWLALGIAYLAYLTRGFRREPPEFVPEGD